MVNRFLSHHGAHISTPGRIADHSGAAADECNRPVSEFLHMGHDHNLQKMPNMQTVRRRVKTNIKSYFLLRKQLFNFFFMCKLRQQPSFF